MPGRGSTGLLCRLNDDGTVAGQPEYVADLTAAVAAGEQADRVRWVWSSAQLLYPRLLTAGVRVARCHDVALTSALLLGRDGGPGPLAVPSGSDAATGLAGAARAPELPFDGSATELPDPLAELAALIEVHASQLAAIAADPDPSRFGLLAAAESAGGLVAAEMTAAGVPWRADVHDRVLTELLGPRPAATSGPPLRPARLGELAMAISAALGAVRPVNPDSPAQLIKALAASGIRVSSTRSAELRLVDHPAIPLLLEYKELARLHAANGWAWLDTWVSDGRFRPEYVVGGVVSGRWASRGGGALQIPKILRQAVVADPGWTLVAADAAQLEPRVLAALAGDRGFARTGGSGDLYDAVAAAIGSDRPTAKVALLSAMYGGTGGDGGQSLALLRRRIPAGVGIRRGGGKGRGRRQGRPVGPRPDLPAAVGCLAGGHQRVR